MWLYGVAILFLLATIISLIVLLVNYQKSNKPDLSEEDKVKTIKKYKNALFFFIVFAVICEAFILLAKKFAV